MRRVRVAALAAVLACAVGIGAAARTPPAGSPADTKSGLVDGTPADVLIEAGFKTAVAAAQEGDAEGILLALEAAVRDDIFPHLSRERRLQVAQLYAAAANHQGEWAAAHKALVRVTAEMPDDRGAWIQRLDAAISTGDGADAHLALRHLRDVGEPVLMSFDGARVLSLDQLLGTIPDAQEARLALGREMERERWSSPHASDDMGVLWLHYAQGLMARGDAKGAAVAAGRITDPVVIMAMQADRRFDAIIAANPSLQDARAAAERNLRRARAYAQANPRLLDGTLWVASALTVLDREAEAAPMLDAAARAIGTAGRRAPPFDDMELASTLVVFRASALIAVGRTDEAIGVRLSEASCNCSPWAVLALTRTLMQAGRAEEARRWLAEARMMGLAPQDKMELTQIKACVAAQSKDGDELAKALEFLAANEAWKPEALVEALVCADRMPAAEAALKRQLADPRFRLTALSRLQTYAPDRDDLKFYALVKERWTRLAASPALRAEIAKVGRQNRFDLQQLGSVS